MAKEFSYMSNLSFLHASVVLIIITGNKALNVCSNYQCDIVISFEIL